MSDLIFALFHLCLLGAVITYAFLSLLQGNTTRFLVIGVCLIGYYFLVLHKSVRKEIKRRRENHSK